MINTSIIILFIIVCFAASILINHFLELRRKRVIAASLYKRLNGERRTQLAYEEGYRQAILDKNSGVLRGQKRNHT